MQEVYPWTELHYSYHLVLHILIKKIATITADVTENLLCVKHYVNYFKCLMSLRLQIHPLGQTLLYSSFLMMNTTRVGSNLHELRQAVTGRTKMGT